MGALADARFRRLLAGQSLSSFGDTALYLSLAIWAKDLSGSNAAAGAVFFALGLPVLAAPLAGHLADRVGRRRLASPLVGAALYARFGGGTLALLDAGTFAAAVLALLSIKLHESPPDHDPQPLLTQVTAGFRHLRHTPVLAPITLAVAVAFSVIGFFESVDFAVIDQGLHRPASFFGVLNSVQGAGSILGGLTASMLLRRLGEARTVGLALLVDGVGALALTPPRLQGRVAAATNLLTSGPQTAQHQEGPPGRCTGRGPSGLPEGWFVALAGSTPTRGRQGSVARSTRNSPLGAATHKACHQRGHAPTGDARLDPSAYGALVLKPTVPPRGTVLPAGGSCATTTLSDPCGSRS